MESLRTLSDGRAGPTNEGPWVTPEPGRLAPSQDGPGSANTQADTSTSATTTASTGTPEATLTFGRSLWPCKERLQKGRGWLSKRRWFDCLTKPDRQRAQRSRSDREAQMFKLRLPPSEIRRWAKSYSYPGEERIVNEMSPRARARGHLTRLEFLELCRWKSPRSQPRCAVNTASQVHEATAIALATADERAKTFILRSLAGVGWPTASVILHFCDRRPYPILDYRALWSLGFAKPPTYTFDFWWAYTQFMRRLAHSTGYDMRTLDRALWQFSKGKQR